MIAIDTNLLVYAHRGDMEQHERAFSLISDALNGPERIGLCWPVLHEFLAIVTNPRIFVEPSPTPLALAQVEAWTSADNSAVLGEAPDHLSILAQVLSTSGISGSAVHDARIAAICLANGVRLLWTADRDFTRIPALSTVNPLVDGRP